VIRRLRGNADINSSRSGKSQEGREYFTPGATAQGPPGTVPCANNFTSRAGEKETVAMRSILLWLIGIPIPIILLLALCTHHF